MNKLLGHVLASEKLAEIAAMYGVRVASFGTVEGGYRNLSHSFTGDNGRKYNFILYKREPGSAALIERTNELGLQVAAKGLPVRAPVDARILRVGTRYGSLYEYLDGVTIPWEAYTMKHIKLLGLAMAKFHAAAAEYDGPALPDVESVYLEILGRMERYFADEPVSGAVTEKLRLQVCLPNFSSFLKAAKQMPGRTPLHMDFVRSNILFTEENEKLAKLSSVKGTAFSREGEYRIGNIALTGILDLEKAAVGHPLFDVARTLAFLLVDCPKPAEKVRKYFLDSGYRKRGERSLPSVMLAGGDMLEQLITLFLTYDFYKFLKQNPYESLSKNHHFKRTVAILLTRKVLQLVS